MLRTCVRIVQVRWENLRDSGQDTFDDQDQSSASQDAGARAAPPLPLALAGGVRECGILRDFRKGTKPSDHAPLRVTLDLP